MQQEPIRDIDIVRSAIDATRQDVHVFQVLGEKNLMQLGQCIKSFVTAHSGTAQIATYHGLLDLVGDILMSRRGVFASEALYDEIREAVRPSLGQLRQSFTPDDLEDAYKAFCQAIVSLLDVSEDAGDVSVEGEAPSNAELKLRKELDELRQRVAVLESALAEKG